MIDTAKPGAMGTPGLTRYTETNKPTLPQLTESSSGAASATCRRPSARGTASSTGRTTTRAARGPETQPTNQSLCRMPTRPDYARLSDPIPGMHVTRGALGTGGAKARPRLNGHAPAEPSLAQLTARLHEHFGNFNFALGKLPEEIPGLTSDELRRWEMLHDEQTAGYRMKVEAAKRAEAAVAESTAREAKEREKAAHPVPQFFTPAEVRAFTPEKPDWVLTNYVVHQGITEIDGKVKVAGKTTLIADMVRCILSGEPWAGHSTVKTEIVWLTEQTKGTFRRVLDTAQISDDLAGLHIRFREDFKGTPWPQVVAEAVAECERVGAGLLIVDTIAKLARIQQENDSADWTNALELLQDAATTNLAIIISRHARKAEGDTGDTGRGNSAASGDVDIILDLRRLPGPASTRRSLTSASRYDETPVEAIINLTAEGYVYLGTERDVSAADAMRFVLSHIGRAFETDQTGVTGKALVAAGEDAEPPVSRAAIYRALTKATMKDLTVTYTEATTRGHERTYALIVSKPPERPTS